MRRLLLVGLLGVALVLVASGLGYAAPDRAAIAIRYSHFETSVIEAKAGAPITITLRNDDPIEHEWIVGEPDAHQRHRTGSEPYHASLPTEVTLPALSTRTTTVTFERPGVYAYICHLPGHEAYGMTGIVRVE